jgi:hypothetical protein
MVRGTDNTFEFVLTDGFGNPVDISADEVQVTVRDYYSGDIKIQKANLAGTHLDGPNGKTAFTFTRADLAEAAETETTFWLYEVRRVRIDATENVHIQGQFVIVPAVGGNET